MEISELRGFESEKVLSVKFKRALKTLPKIAVRFVAERGKLYITTGSGGRRAEIEADSDKAYITGLAEDRLCYIAGVLSYQNGTANIRTVTYRELETPSAEFVCSVSDSMVKTMSCKPEELCKAVSERSVCKLGAGQYCWVLGYRFEEDESLPEMVLVCSANDGYIHITKKSVSGKSILVCDGVSAEIPAHKYLFKLNQGAIGFVREKDAERTAFTAATIAHKIESDSHSFFRLWNEYGSNEFEEQLGILTETGVMECDEVGVSDGCFSLKFSNWKRTDILLELLGRKAAGAGLSLWSEMPYDEINSIKNELSKRMSGEPIDYNHVFGILKKAFVNSERVTIDPSFDITEYYQTHSIPISFKSGIDISKIRCVTYNPIGDVTIFERRIEARDLISQGRCSMPVLGQILEDMYEGYTGKSERRIKTIPAKLEKEVFGERGPTPVQREAVLTAVNTPDIAIIQGPPGTGKTTVITCIIRMLDEMGSAKDGKFGRNLITAFQHDAVENAISRIENFGLPAVKIGTRGSKREINSKIKSWALKQQYDLEAKYPEISRSMVSESFSDSRKAYLRSSNSISSTIAVLEEAMDMLSSIEENESSTARMISKVLSSYKQQRDSSSVCAEKSVIGVVSILPMHPVQFTDNGEELVKKAITMMRAYGSIFEEDARFLEDFLKQSEDERDYAKMRRFRARFISANKPRPAIFSTPQENVIVQKLLNDAADLYSKYVKKNRSPETAILEDYYNDIRRDYGYIRDTILAYSSVSGATNQHAVSDEIFALKGNEYYDNVLVDEAARSNPLDLLIPMARSKERIILVGDHRQLPHMLDDKIAKKIEEKGIDEEERREIQKILEQSLFGRLKKILNGIEKKDGIKRCITLDRQFRTHPMLGKFVSEMFYENQDSRERFDSPRPAEEFSHSLPGIGNKAAVWMEVPAEKGAEKSSGNSKIRPAEAKAIVSHLKEMMDSEAGASLSFGVITFYSGQINEIYKELVRAGMAENTPDGVVILEKYEWQEYYENGKLKTRQRLKIGSVDSFQGMEFDVVYLSVVRSNREGKVGFLGVENRLCVAMSRQRKLLIVAGDSKMFNSKDKVPSLYEFRRLCEDKENIYGQVI